MAIESLVSIARNIAASSKGNRSAVVEGVEIDGLGLTDQQKGTLNSYDTGNGGNSDGQIDESEFLKFLEFSAQQTPQLIINAPDGQKRIITTNGALSDSNGSPVDEKSQRRMDIYAECKAMQERRFLYMGGPNVKDLAFNVQLDEIFSDGKMTKDEFARFMGLDPDKVTDGFWSLFSDGDGVISSESEFLAALKECRNSLTLTGDTLRTLAKSENIIPVSLSKLTAAVRAKGFTAADLANSPLLKHIFDRALSYTDRDKTDFSNLSDDSWRNFAFLLYYELAVNSGWHDHGFSDAKKIKLTDELVIHKFVEKAKEKVMKQGLTKQDFADLLEFQEKAEREPAWAEAELEKINREIPAPATQ